MVGSFLVQRPGCGAYRRRVLSRAGEGVGRGEYDEESSAGGVVAGFLGRKGALNRGSGCDGDGGWSGGWRGVPAGVVMSGCLGIFLVCAQLTQAGVTCACNAALIPISR
jgi:hypothetical protein